MRFNHDEDGINKYGNEDNNTTATVALAIVSLLLSDKFTRVPDKLHPEHIKLILRYFKSPGFTVTFPTRDTPIPPGAPT